LPVRFILIFTDYDFNILLPTRQNGFC
jgi:hypothetical protein